MHTLNIILSPKINQKIQYGKTTSPSQNIHIPHPSSSLLYKYISNLSSAICLGFHSLSLFPYTFFSLLLAPNTHTGTPLQVQKGEFTTKRKQWENLVVTRKTSIKVLGPSKKTKSSLTTSEFMVKAVGVPFPKLLVS